MSKLERDIRRAYWVLAQGRPQTWVKLTDLRNMLDEHDTDVDNTLRTMMLRFDGVHLVPEADQKHLTREDRERAVLIGGVPNHLIAIEAPESRSAR